MRNDTARKLRLLTIALNDYYRKFREYIINESPEWAQDMNPFITRTELKRLIKNTTGLTDRQTIDSWIGFLNAKQLIYVQRKGAYKQIKCNPSQKTKYFIKPPHLTLQLWNSIHQEAITENYSS